MASVGVRGRGSQDSLTRPRPTLVPQLSALSESLPASPNCELPKGGGSVPSILALARSPHGGSRMVGLDPTKRGWGGWTERKEDRTRTLRQRTSWRCSSGAGSHLEKEQELAYDDQSSRGWMTNDRPAASLQPLKIPWHAQMWSAGSGSPGQDTVP